MTGFEPGSSGIGSDRSANCATTTAQQFYLFGQIQTRETGDQRYSDISLYGECSLGKPCSKSNKSNAL